MAKSPALLYEAHGDPVKVVHLGEVDLPSLGEADALVRMLAAPINPADLNVIEGVYPIRPPLPAVPGGEGLAAVVETGTAVKDVQPGDHVLLPHALGSWREAAVIPAAELVVIPNDLPVEQAAMLRVNPATAFRMLADFVDLDPGGWVVQNAANSGVGRAVIQIARNRGIRTINVVRRPELIAELRSLGADAVLLDSENLEGEIESLTGGCPPRLALNAVGGESALHLAGSLAAGGTLVTYGAMGRKPLRIPNGLLIFKDLRFRGFWVSQWYRSAPASQRMEMIRYLAELIRQGVIHAPVEKIFSLEECTEALARASEGQRAGKILFRGSSGS